MVGEAGHEEGLHPFKKLDDVPLKVVGQLVARKPLAEYVGRYIALRDGMTSQKR